MGSRSPQDKVGAVRCLREDSSGAYVGHIALVHKTDPERGLWATLVTTAEPGTMWLPHALEGRGWDWLLDLDMQVSYLESERSKEHTTYDAKIVNWDLDKFLLCVAWEGWAQRDSNHTMLGSCRHRVLLDIVVAEGLQPPAFQ